MKLYFFRHGHAEDAQMPDFDDFTRALTLKGIERTKAAGKALVRLGVKPARLYSSPRLRSRQTADLLANALGVSVAVREEVNFGFNMQGVQALVADAQTGDEIVFVGHEPDFSITVSALIGGGEVIMKKGGLARVDISSSTPLRGVLAWLLTPSLLDVLGAE
jgi:phosphohistidine phosphatase